jgi:hypothetical protein
LRHRQHATGGTGGNGGATEWMWYMQPMNDVHLGTFDLNLLLALDALTERSVMRASARIGITQSAASHALARLRKLTGG